MNGIKHKNYEILNLIGYGLAKFDINFIKDFGFKSKTEFYNYIVKLGIAETTGTVKNRQDLFDPFFENKRKGWWQKGDAYIHRKIVIDNLFGNLSADDYSNIVKLYIKEKFNVPSVPTEIISPILISRFKQLQMTGLEAEEYFKNNFETIEKFKYGKLEDARMLGDGYDFQVKTDEKFFLIEIKGIRNTYGSIRLTEKEYRSAKENKDLYVLIVVSNLVEVPKFRLLFNPINSFPFKKKTVKSLQISYHLGPLTW